MASDGNCDARRRAVLRPPLCLCVSVVNTSVPWKRRFTTETQSHRGGRRKARRKTQRSKTGNAGEHPPAFRDTRASPHARRDGQSIPDRPQSNRKEQHHAATHIRVQVRPRRATGGNPPRPRARSGETIGVTASFLRSPGRTQRGGRSCNPLPNGGVRDRTARRPRDPKAGCEPGGAQFTHASVISFSSTCTR